MKRSMLSWILLVFCVLLSACGQHPAPVAGIWQDQYNLGVRYLSEGNYEEAIIAFSAAIEIDPKRAPAYVGRGDAHSGVALLAVEGIEGLSDEAVMSYQSAAADYLAAIDLDGTKAEVYRKAAEVYVALGDIDAALDILSRGIEATGDQSLQDYLDELSKEREPIYLLIQQSAYEPDGTLVGTYTYSYDEQGYILSLERNEANRTRVDVWDYDGEPGHCRYIPDKQDYESKEEWLASQDEMFMAPGQNNVYWGHITSDYSVHTDPLIDTELRTTVLANGGVLINEFTSNENWSYAIYTFDEAGNPISIATYNDSGAVTGTATLKWRLLGDID